TGQAYGMIPVRRVRILRRPGGYFFAHHLARPYVHQHVPHVLVFIDGGAERVDGAAVSARRTRNGAEEIAIPERQLSPRAPLLGQKKPRRAGAIPPVAAVVVLVA